MKKIKNTEKRYKLDYKLKTDNIIIVHIKQHTKANSYHG